MPVKKHENYQFWKTKPLLLIYVYDSNTMSLDHSDLIFTFLIIITFMIDKCNKFDKCNILLLTEH